MNMNSITSDEKSTTIKGTKKVKVFSLQKT